MRKRQHGRLPLTIVGLGCVVYSAGWIAALGVFLFGCAVWEICTDGQ